MKFLQKRQKKRVSSSVTVHRRSLPGLVSYVRKSAPVTGLIVVTNLVTYLMLGPGFVGPSSNDFNQKTEQLYLIDKAATHIYDVESFASGVKRVANKLDVPADWLMAIMYSESRFNPSIANHKGSGATGLIQFMPATAKDFGTSTHKLANMTPVQQLEYVYKYFDRVRRTYGDFKSLTDCYLAVLYPRALNKDYCYTLYAKPSIAYKRNIGLDENKDGHVTVSDIDRRMARIFPTAYTARLQKDGESLADKEFFHIEDQNEGFFNEFDDGSPEKDVPSFLD
jgi:hypothetical protein